MAVNGVDGADSIEDHSELDVEAPADARKWMNENKVVEVGQLEK